MDKNKSPAFQFYAKDWLGSQRVSLMSLEEEGAYIRALCYAWNHGSLPSDPDMLARLIGKGASTTLATTIQAMFVSGPNPGSLVHERLEAEREKQIAWRQKSSEGGRKSAEIRSKTNHPSTTLQPPLEGSLENGANQMATLQFASASSSSSSFAYNDTSKCIKGADAQQPMGEPSTIELPLEKPAPRPRFTPPTMKEVKLHAAKMGLPDTEAEKFWHYWESAGWRRKSGVMKSWTSSMVYWKSNYEEKRAPRRIEPDYRDNDIAGIEDLRKQWAEDAERVRREDEANGGFPPGWGPADDAKRAAEAAAAQAGAGQK